MYVKLKPGAHICNPNTLSQGDRKQRQPDPQKFTAQLDCKGILFKKKKKKDTVSNKLESKGQQPRLSCDPPYTYIIDMNKDLKNTPKQNIILK